MSGSTWDFHIKMTGMLTILLRVLKGKIEDLASTGCSGQSQFYPIKVLLRDVCKEIPMSQMLSCCLSLVSFIISNNHTCHFQTRAPFPPSLQSGYQTFLEKHLLSCKVSCSLAHCRALFTGKGCGKPLCMCHIHNRL